ncbi:putative bifunctional diguanylate cyclase/phosphodiesterase [Endozoicomonas ascidiicola]|uniref:putative bifunctional diguanylate cyclase/phosphodiesterase n=1 Tax=Endozoicomonas ascidiicola TaxID=1698521 RepID=UPI000829DB95|nr:GGDEF domain-containing phosphodiesterase [Endozoicomonas ascidiicola]
MDTKEGTHGQSQLSHQLLKVVLLCACLLGVLLSLVQVFIEARQTSIAIDKRGQEILAMIHEPAHKALSRFDNKMAQEILNGVMEVSSVQAAAIRLEDQSLLARTERPLSHSRYRLLTDAIFTPIRTFRHSMSADSHAPSASGEVILYFDTAYEGKSFVQRSVTIVLVGLVRAITMALVLFFIYSTLLTKPLNRLIFHLTGINPKHPGKAQLPIPKGHEKNELGLWVTTANKLLHSIDKHYSLRQKAEERIMRLSQYDYLTRLPNRRSLQKHLNRLIKQSSTSDSMAVICLGLDDFKSLNIQLNFNAAEHVLVKLSDRLRNHVNNKTYLGRLGEDQFAIILSDVSQPYEAAELTQSLLQEFEKPFVINDEFLTVTATAGITLFPNDGDNVDKLLQQAEFAMIMAKSRNRNRYQFYIATIDSDIRQRKRLEMDLHQALENQELSLVYQPQFSCENGELVGIETLIRWHHPDRGLISPDLFIPMAEQSMDIIPIGNWVLETACHQLKQWQNSGYHGLRMAINLSAVQLQDPDIVDRVIYLLNKYQFSPDALELEVTETFIMEDIEIAKLQLNQLKSLGITLTLDDFGTGYSSLGYLKQFPFDKVKIDKSFIEGLPEHKENGAIVDAIIQIGKSFGMVVLAEGVETLEQELCLKEKGCQEGQGYYYGKPLPADAFIEHLTNLDVLPRIPGRANG